MHTAKANSITIEPPPLTGGTEAVYYFHSDHLGSASWITDGSGLPVQHLQYLPLGEHFVNERSTAYDERFTFTGKERDAETGYYYHGARFNSSDIGWLSVDPQFEKLPSTTPYNYCLWNPVFLHDPDGEIPFFPPWHKYHAYIIENLSSNHNVKEAAYFVQHPMNALRTGVAKDGGRNLSSISHNFAYNIQKAANLTGGGEGDQRNAIRHTLWQAILVKEFGVSHAKRIANAHEDYSNIDIKIDINQRTFHSLGEADKVVDLLNNEIGRKIGVKNRFANNKTLAKKVVEEFCYNGLWTSSTNDDGSVSIQKTKITKEEMQKAIVEINKKNNFGLDD